MDLLDHVVSKVQCSEHQKLFTDSLQQTVLTLLSATSFRMRLSGVLDINCQRRSSEKHEELQLKKPELVRRTRQDQASAKYSSIDLPTPRRREGEIVRVYGVE